MIDAELGDAACRRIDDHVGRVEPAAQPDLDHARVGGRLGEGQEGGGGGYLEKARADPVRHVEHAREQVRERRVGDQPARDADALVEADEVRGCVGVDAVPLRLQCGAKERAGRSLTVGPGDVKHRRQAEVGVAETAEQVGDSRQSKYVSAWRQRGQPVELRLDGGGCRGGVIHCTS